MLSVVGNSDANWKRRGGKRRLKLSPAPKPVRKDALQVAHGGNCTRYCAHKRMAPQVGLELEAVTRRPSRVPKSRAQSRDPKRMAPQVGLELEAFTRRPSRVPKSRAQSRDPKKNGSSGRTRT